MITIISNCIAHLDATTYEKGILVGIAPVLIHPNTTKIAPYIEARAIVIIKSTGKIIAIEVQRVQIT